MNTMKNLKNTLKRCVKWTTSMTKRTTAMTTTSNTETSKRICEPFYVDGQMFWDAENDIIKSDDRVRRLRTN